MRNNGSETGQNRNISSKLKKKKKERKELMSMLNHKGREQEERDESKGRERTKKNPPEKATK